MLHAALADKTFRPRFSGHETFPLRYNWLYKVLRQRSGPHPHWMPRAPLERDMVRYGVGKNMVHSMHHWAELCGVATLKRDSSGVELSDLGKWLRKRDPYLEEAGTIWTLHWKVATTPQVATTWYWMFNGYPSPTFDERAAVDSIRSAAATFGWRAPSTGTIERDVDCFVRCYTVSRAKKGILTEDSMECPFAELELVQPTPERGVYEFQRGPKPTLPDTVFAFALAEFLEGLSASTVSFEHIAHAPGSPGRVFKLDEASVAERLERLAAARTGSFRWIDTAGLRQLQRVGDGARPLAALSEDGRHSVAAE